MYTLRVKPCHLPLEHNDTLKSKHGSAVFKPVEILPCIQLTNCPPCVGEITMSPSHCFWREVLRTISSMEELKEENQEQRCCSYNCNFILLHNCNDNNNPIVHIVNKDKDTSEDKQMRITN